MDAYIGEIRIFSGNFAPQDWAFCDGSLLAISQYEALYSLVGTTYGGNGSTQFGLPDLRGRAPLHRRASAHPIGQKSGTETVTLTEANLPPHAHTWQAYSGQATTNLPANNLLASVPTGSTLYEPASTIDKLVPVASLSVGMYPNSAAPINNMQPFLAMSFIIALSGLYPSQS